MAAFTIQENPFLSIKLVEIISENTGLTMEEATDIVRYNCISIFNLAKITNFSVQAIQHMIKPSKKEKSKLTCVFPFRFKDNKGFTFIVFDKACYDYIISSHKPINAINHEEIPGDKRQP